MIATTDLLLDAAIESRDPMAFRVLADALDDAGDSRQANGWRKVAVWMETPWNATDKDYDGKVRWPRISKANCWLFKGENQWGNSTPFGDGCVEFLNATEAMKWVCEQFAAE